MSVRDILATTVLIPGVVVGDGAVGKVSPVQGFLSYASSAYSLPGPTMASCGGQGFALTAHHINIAANLVARSGRDMALQRKDEGKG